MVKRRRQAGFVYMDAMIALVLLGGAILTSLVFFRAEAKEIRGSHERLSALLVAESEMEHLRATPFEAVPLGTAMPLVPTVPSAGRIKALSETLTVVEGGPGMKEATVRVEWDSPKGLRRHVELTGWISGEVTP
jgi:hypothetical protein